MAKRRKGKSAMALRLVIVLVCFFLFGQGIGIKTALAGRRPKKIEVPVPLKDHLNALLNAGNNLHLACVGKNERQIEEALQAMLVQLSLSTQKSSLAKSQQRNLMRTLNATRTNIEASQMLTGTQRKESLKALFNQLVQIAQFYHLDKYKVYFCGKDRTVWIQKSGTAKNPVHPDKHPDCGKPVGS